MLLHAKRFTLFLGLISLTFCSFADRKPKVRQYTEFDTIDGLLVYRPMGIPHMAFGSAPSVQDTNILFCCEAARTQRMSTPFSHTDVCGDHVADMRRYSGTGNSANNGGFVYYNGMYRFTYNSFSSTSSELNNAADRRDGIGFEQTTIIHNYEFFRQTIASGRKNTGYYRSLCQRDDTLYVVETLEEVTFAQFVWMLTSFGARNAICLDISGNKSASFFRDKQGKAHKMLQKGTSNSTSNWLYFTTGTLPAPDTIGLARRLDSISRANQKEVVVENMTPAPVVEPAPAPQKKQNPTTSKDKKSSGKKIYYTVKEGDSLSKIAAKYKDKSITASSIKKLNGLKSDSIKPGQKLRIK